jgi:hypothetical protein
MLYEFGELKGPFVVSLYSMKNKCMANPTERERTRQQIFLEQKPSKAWIPSYGLLNIRGNIQNIRLECQRRMLHT